MDLCPLERVALPTDTTPSEQGAFAVGHRPRLPLRHRFPGVILSLLILFGLVGPLPVAHASTINDARTFSGSRNVAHVAYTVSLLPDGQLASEEQYFPGAAPVLSLPGTIMVDATSSLGAAVTYFVSATDPDNPASLPTITCTPSSGSTFPIGTTAVLCTASDAFGTTSGSFLVIVVDRTPPVLSLPGTIMANATGPQGAVVTYIVNASDPVTPAYQLTITCIPPSGSTFPIGTTTVLCTASDPAGNSTSGSFQVTVLNRTAPVLSLPGTIMVDATSSLGATVTYTVSATNPNDPANLPIITCVSPSGSIFPIGTTTVLCTARDLAGNTTNGNFIVIVKGAAAQLSDLLTLIDGFSSSAKLPALVTRLRDALTAVNVGKTSTACSALTQFIVLVEAESGKRLSVSQANQLLTDARRIQAVLACY
jgi:hypothetical protein